MPATDFRLYNTFWTRLDVQLLDRALSAAGVLALIHLHTWATEHYASGILPDCPDRIEIGAAWKGDAGAFYRGALDAGSLIESAQGLHLKHWRDEQDWASSGPERSQWSKDMHALKAKKKRVALLIAEQTGVPLAGTPASAPVPDSQESPESPDSPGLFDSPKSPNSPESPVKPGTSNLEPRTAVATSRAVSHCDRAALRIAPYPYPPPSPVPKPPPDRSPFPPLPLATLGNSERFQSSFQQKYSAEWLAAARVLEKNGWSELEATQGLTYLRNVVGIPADMPLYKALAMMLKAAQMRTAGQLRGELLHFVSGKKVGVNDDLLKLAKTEFERELG